LDSNNRTGCATPRDLKGPTPQARAAHDIVVTA
jgi:hypothetical protein